MPRLLLPLLTLLALAVPAASATAAKPYWPLAHTPLTLTPEACAADPGCAAYVARRDAALAAEAPQQRAERERRALAATATPRERRAIDRTLRKLFDLGSLDGLDRATRTRLRRASDPVRLRQELERRLAARGWSANDFGDLLAFQFVLTWQTVNEGEPVERATAEAFRGGLRDLLARSPMPAELRRPRQRYVSGQALAMMVLFCRNSALAFPPDYRERMWDELTPLLIEAVESTFGVDPRDLLQAEGGFDGS